MNDNGDGNVIRILNQIMGSAILDYKAEAVIFSPPKNGEDMSVVLVVAGDNSVEMSVPAECIEAVMLRLRYLSGCPLSAQVFPQIGRPSEASEQEVVSPQHPIVAVRNTVPWSNTVILIEPKNLETDEKITVFFLPSLLKMLISWSKRNSANLVEMGR